MVGMLGSVMVTDSHFLGMSNRDYSLITHIGYVRSEYDCCLITCSGYVKEKLPLNHIVWV